MKALTAHSKKCDMIKYKYDHCRHLSPNEQQHNNQKRHHKVITAYAFYKNDQSQLSLSF